MLVIVITSIKTKQQENEDKKHAILINFRRVDKLAVFTVRMFICLYGRVFRLIHLTHLAEWKIIRSVGKITVVDFDLNWQAFWVMGKIIAVHFFLLSLLLLL